MTEYSQTYSDGFYNESYNISDNFTTFARFGFQSVGHWEALLLLPVVLSGITGNVLVCVAVKVERRLRNETNFFLVSLAVADLLVSCVVMPCCTVQDFIGFWPFGFVLCDAWQACDVMLCTSSIMHMCTISIDRYIGIRSPLIVRHRSPSVVAVKIASVWAISVIIASPVVLLAAMRPDDVMTVTSHVCGINNRPFFVYGSLAAFFVPLVIMLVAYSLSIRLLSRQVRTIASGPGGDGDSGDAGGVMRRSRTVDRRRRGGAGGRLQALSAAMLATKREQTGQGVVDTLHGDGMRGGVVGSSTNPTRRKNCGFDRGNKLSQSTMSLGAGSRTTASENGRLKEALGDLVSLTKPALQLAHEVNYSNAGNGPALRAESESACYEGNKCSRPPPCSMVLNANSCTGRKGIICKRDSRSGSTDADKNSGHWEQDETERQDDFRHKESMARGENNESETILDDDDQHLKNLITANSSEVGSRKCDIDTGRVIFVMNNIADNEDTNNRNQIDNPSTNKPDGLRPILAQGTRDLCRYYNGVATESVVLYSIKPKSDQGEHRALQVLDDALTRDVTNSGVTLGSRSSVSNSTSRSSIHATQIATTEAEVALSPTESISVNDDLGISSRLTEESLLPADFILNDCEIPIRSCPESGCVENTECSGTCSRNQNEDHPVDATVPQRIKLTRGVLADNVRFKSLVQKHSATLRVAGILIVRRDNQKMAALNSVYTERKAVKVLGAMFVIFVVCWAPFFTANLTLGLCGEPCQIDPGLFRAFLWLGYVSSTVNPIVYTVFNKTFRRTFRDLVCCRWRASRQLRQQSRT